MKFGNKHLILESLAHLVPVAVDDQMPQALVLVSTEIIMINLFEARLHVLVEVADFVQQKGVDLVIQL